jgi:hypothetical protein
VTLVMKDDEGVFQAVYLQEQTSHTKNLQNVSKCCSDSKEIRCLCSKTSFVVVFLDLEYSDKAQCTITCSQYVCQLATLKETRNQSANWS